MITLNPLQTIFFPFVLHSHSHSTPVFPGVLVLVRDVDVPFPKIREAPKRSRGISLRDRIAGGFVDG